MITTNSRIRTTRPDQTGSPDTSRQTPLVRGEASQAAVESILLGLTMRCWLTETETNLLQLMTVSGAHLFLVQDGVIFQTEQSDRFTMELASTALASGGEAIYTQRLRLNDGHRESSRYRVHTALLDSHMERPIALGMAEVDSGESASSGDMQFPDLLVRFRSGLQIVHLLHPRVSRLISQETPTMLVNRTSGRISAVNHTLCRLLDKEEAAIVDREFGQIKKQLLSVLPGSAMKMQNITHGSLNLASIEIKPRIFSSQTDDADPFMVDFFTHKMRNKISAITTAASHLEATGLDDINSDQTELTRIILKEAADMDHFLSRLNLIVNYRLLKREGVQFGEELYHALRSVRQVAGNEAVIDFFGDLSATLKEQPQRAVSYLIEAALWSHLYRRRHPSRTEITASAGTEAGSVIRIESRVSPEEPRSGRDQNWSSFACRLAEVMSVRINESKGAGPNMLATTLTFPEKTKG